MRVVPLIGFLLAASTASAQDMPVFTPSMSWPEAASMSQFGLLASQARKRAAGQEATETVRPMSASEFAYTPSLTRRRANFAQFVQRSRRGDPIGAAQMEQIFAGTDVIATMNRELAPYGLRTDNVADAYSVYWMNAWGAAHGDTSLPSRATAQAVRAQVADTLAAVPAMREADDAIRQEFAEALLVQAALISATQEAYQNDPAMAAKLAAAVRKGARESGLDLDAMTLTEQGFVSAKEVGAAALEAGGRSDELAATERLGATSSYGLLAMGGAGLGAAFLLGKVTGRKG